MSQLAVGREPHSGDHATMAYRSLPELIAKLDYFVSHGLASGDLVLYICDDHAVGAVRAELARIGDACAGALDSGQLQVMSSREAFFTNGSFNVESSLGTFARTLRGAVASGYRRIRAICEMTYLLAPIPVIERAGEFEARANAELFSVYPFLCVCPMNLQRDVNGTWDGILRSHPTLYDDGHLFPNPRYQQTIPALSAGDASSPRTSLTVAP